MEYTSLQELYQSLIPAFNVKKRLLSINKFNDITNKDIWEFLANTKWRTSINLTLSDMVNDIITADYNKIKSFIQGGKQ